MYSYLPASVVYTCIGYLSYSITTNVWTLTYIDQSIPYLSTEHLRHYSVHQYSNFLRQPSITPAFTPPITFKLVPYLYY